MDDAELKYKVIEGEHDEHELMLYGLLICEPCRKAEAFLKENGFQHKHVILEYQKPDVRHELKKHFQEEYGGRPIYPVLRVDGEYLFGFDPDVWHSYLESS